MISLRPAAAKDAPRIRELVRSAQINPLGLDWERFTVALDDDEIVACGQIKPHRDGSYELASLVVDPTYRGLGIARALVEYLITNHEGNLYLMCRASLGGFYKKLGFEPVPKLEMPPYFRKVSRLASLVELLQKEGETLLVMHKT